MNNFVIPVLIVVCMFVVSLLFKVDDLKGHISSLEKENLILNSMFVESLEEIKKIKSRMQRAEHIIVERFDNRK